MTHHVRPSFRLSDTTFHFVDDDPATVLTQAKDADGKHVRLGGGLGVVREFLDADLIDTLHVAVVPGVELGSGERLWTSPEGCPTAITATSCPAPVALCTICSGGSDGSFFRDPECYGWHSGSHKGCPDQALSTRSTITIEKTASATAGAICLSPAGRADDRADEVEQGADGSRDFPVATTTIR